MVVAMEAPDENTLPAEGREEGRGEGSSAYRVRSGTPLHDVREGRAGERHEGREAEGREAAGREAEGKDGSRGEEREASEAKVDEGTGGGAREIGEAEMRDIREALLLNASRLKNLLRSNKASANLLLS